MSRKRYRYVDASGDTSIWYLTKTMCWLAMHMAGSCYPEERPFHMETMVFPPAIRKDI